MAFLTEEQLTDYRENGYIVVRGLLSPTEVAATKEEMKQIIDTWYDDFEKTGKEGPAWEEIVNRDAAVAKGELVPENRYLAVRRLYRMVAQRNEFFVKLTQHEKLTTACKQILGDSVRLLQSMALLKPPGTAEKRWHQDNAYFRLTPLDVMGCWIAIDKAFVENGCMHVAPKSHLAGVAQHKVPDWADEDAGGRLYGLAEIPDKAEVTALPMEPGDALLFHGATKHFTPPNNSTVERYAVQYHYAAAHCQPTVCPETLPSSVMATEGTGPDDGVDRQPAFDCDPCTEPQFWFFRKAEMTILGSERGGVYI